MSAFVRIGFLSMVFAIIKKKIFISSRSDSFVRGWDTRSGLFGAIARVYGLSSTLHASSSMLKSGPAT